MNEVETCEKIIVGLEDQRERAGVRIGDITAEQRCLGYAVHAAGDQKAKAKLAALNREMSEISGMIESLDGALLEARKRLDAAQQVEARAERRAAIKLDQQRSKEFRELGPFLDKAIDNLRRGAIALKNNAPAVGRDWRHVATLYRVLAIALVDTPFREHLPRPDANDRATFSTFSQVIDGWCSSRDAELARELALLDSVPEETAKVEVSEQEHRQRARSILKELAEIAPTLDRVMPHPDGSGDFCPADPPTCIKAATLVSALLTELRALRLDNGATFPKHWHGAASKEDLRSALLKMLQAWHYVPPGDYRPRPLGRRLPHHLSFSKIFGDWAKILISGPLGEQTKTEKADAAA